MKELNLTEGPILKNLILFSLPIGWFLADGTGLFFIKVKSGRKENLITIFDDWIIRDKYEI